MADGTMGPYIERELAWAKAGLAADGEALGLDEDGCIVFWGAEAGSAYVTGDTPESFGVERLGTLERDRMERDGWHPAPITATGLR